MGGEVVSLAAEVVPYASAAVGAYGGAVLAKVRDDAADATVGLGRRVLQKIFGTRLDWQRVAVPVRLDVLDARSAVEVITVRTRHATGQDQADAAAVAGELGFLPLALDQAAAYMIQVRIRPGGYLARLREHPARMYAAAAGQAQQTITRLWNITIDAIRGRDPGAIWLLRVIACYAPRQHSPHHPRRHTPRGPGG